MGAGVRTAVAAALVVLAAALAAQPAAAWRTPTPQELEELAGATGPPTDPACVSGRISTVDERWGALFARAGEQCARPPRTWVLERPRPGTPGGRWRELGQGVRFGVCAKDLPGILDAAGVDLGVCAPPSREVYAPVGARYAVKPRTLPFGATAKVTGIRWSRWGGATAVGRGTFVYADRFGDGFRVPAVVTLSARGLCGARRTYLAKQVAAVRAQDGAALRPWRSRWFVQCPGVVAAPGR